MKRCRGVAGRLVLVPARVPAARLACDWRYTRPIDMTTPPTPDDVLQARQAAGQTQEEAAAVVGLSGGIRWSEYERDERRMDPVRWQLYLLVTEQHPTHQLAKRRAPLK